MNKDNNTFGGFDILGDILTGDPDNNNPSDPFGSTVEDPIVEPTAVPNEGDDDPIVDPSQTNNNEPTEPVEPTEPSKDPIDPSTVPTEPTVDDPTKDTEPVVTEPISLQEEEPLMVEYLQEELYKRFGWELPENEKLQDMDSLTEFLQTVVEESSKPKYASTELEQLNDYVQNGGSLEKYLDQRYNGNVDIEKLDMSQNANQSLVLREYFKRQGYSMDKIERKIQTYEDTGVLSEEANDAHELLKNNIKKEAETLLNEQEKISRETTQRQQKYVNDVLSSIDNKTDVRGIPLTPIQKKKLKDYMFKTDQDGITQFQKYYNNSVDPFIEAAFFGMQGNDLVGKLNTQATSEAAKKLKERLAAKTKRNKSVPQEGGSASNTDYSALSSLGSTLTGGSF